MPARAMTVKLNVVYPIYKALIAAHELDIGVPWLARYLQENQAHATGGGWILIQGFYRKATRPLSEALASRQKFIPPHDVK